MANAWCINAYDCNGCLIQTLQNLDSACIGVGVQYTAPNPLDDKRLDYIKYTDKCGCTCCLSAENEILIYATDWVIKNLTLTNDDVNEAIKIQWNDIFGSNRAKTVVRYKTGSAPVSITDGTLAVEETTKNQYSSTPFSLTGVLDETTYYFTAFAVDWDGTIINVQSSSITTDFFNWTPNSSRTICYYKLESNINDFSWNSRNWTIRTWSLSYWISWWTKNSAFFNRNTIFSIPNIAWTYWTYTINVWCKPTWTDTWQEMFDNSWSWNTNNVYFNFNGSTSVQEQWSSWRQNFAFQYRPNWWSSAYQTPRWIENLSINTRYNVCVIANSSWVKLYLNWTKIWEVSASWTIVLNNYQSWSWWTWIWWRLNWMQNYFRWYMSEFIFENVNWTESDLVKYVNKTKSLYGL